MKQSFTMKMDEYLKSSGQTINAFSAAMNIPATTVWRAVRGKVLRPSNAARIEQATGGRVTLRELLFPTKMGAGE